MTLNTGVYTVSQPSGVLKLVAPFKVTAPAGVPRSSGTMNARIKFLASSVEIGMPLAMKVISSRNIPTPPTGSITEILKIGFHFPGALV